jgi:hypothetical protein
MNAKIPLRLAAAYRAADYRVASDRRPESIHVAEEAQAATWSRRWSGAVIRRLVLRRG